MKEQRRRLSFYNLTIGITILIFLWFSTPSLYAVSVEGNVTGEGSEGVKMAKEPTDIANAAGDGTFAIPISVPPGIRGMTPELSLSYSSSTGNGRFGIGWNLSFEYPLTIERSTRKGVPTYRTESDEYIIGGQRMIRDGNVFHTQIKNFWKIEILDDACNLCGPNDPRQPTTWQAILKDGTQLIYTYQPWSRSAPKKIFRWYLESITDIYGNRITLHYESQTDNRYAIRHPFLASIKYGYLQPNGGGTPLNEVQFCVSDEEGKCWSEGAQRVDPIVSYRYGLPEVIGNRYERIVIKHNGNAVRTYNLGYEQSPTSNQSRLLWVQEMGINGEVLPHHQFTYQNGDISWSNHTNDYSKTPAFPPAFNVSFFSSIDGSIRSQDMGVRMADLNGDGLVDMIISNNHGSGGTLKKVMINNGDGTFQSFKEGDSRWQIPFYFNEMLDAKLMDRGVRVVDINGDGRADIIQSVYWMNKMIQQICINNGSGWDCQPGEGKLPTPPFVVISRAPGFSANSYDWGMRLADLNGDGLVDIMMAFKQDSKNFLKGVWLNTGKNSWEEVKDGRWSPPYSFVKYAVADMSALNQGLILPMDSGVRMADLNGDGLDDIVVSFKDDTYYKENTRDICMNTGTGFECGHSHNLPYFVKRYSFSDQRKDSKGNDYYVSFDINEDFGSTLTDLDGDGRADLVYSYEEGSHIYSGAYFSRGDNAWENRDLPTLMIFTGTIIETHNKRRHRLDWGVRFGDLNGDGLADYTQGTHLFDQGYYFVSHRNGAKPDLLTGVIFPTGGQVSIGYQPSGWKPLQNGSFCAQPTGEGLVSSPSNKWVVTSIRQYDPLTGHVVERRYAYNGPRYDYLEREFRGFASLKNYLVKADGSEGPYVESCHGQTDALQGLLLKQKSGEGNFFTEVTHTYQPVESPTGVYFQKLMESTTRIISEDGSQEKYYGKQYLEYDSYGNLKRWVDGGDKNTAEDDIEYQNSYLYNTTAGQYIVDRVETGKALRKNGEILSLGRNVYTPDLRFLLEKRTARNYPIAGNETNLISSRYTYHAWGDPRTVTDPRGMVIETIYEGAVGCDNKRIFPCKTILTKGTSSEQSKWTSYDLRYGELSWAIEADGQRTDYSYDGLGRLKTLSKPLLSQSPIEYHAYYLAGNQLSPNRPNVIEVTVVPDGFHVEIAQSFIDGFGKNVQTRQENDGVGHYSGLLVYDWFGQLWKSYLPFEANKTGFISQSSLPSGLQFTETLFKAGKVKMVNYPKIPEGSSQTVNWYGAGYSVVTDPNGILTATHYDAHDRMIRTIKDYQRLNQNTEYKRDELGRLLKTTDARGLSMVYGYDPRGNIVGKNMPEWTMSAVRASGYPDLPYQLRYQYDDGDKLILESWGNDLQIRHVYDIMGRETALCTSQDGKIPNCADGSSQLRRRFYYDRDERGLERPFSRGKMSVALSYDESGRPISRIDYFYNNQGLVEKQVFDNHGQIMELRYKYDNTGRIKSLTDPEGRVIRYAHDNLGRLKNFFGLPAISVNGSVVVSDVEYDPKGRVKRVVHGNGTQTDYSYDDRNFLRSLDHGLDLKGNRIYTVSLSYDLAGNIKKIMNGSTWADLFYDRLHRLDRVDDRGFFGLSFDYDYDATGNLLRKKEKEDISFRIKPNNNLVELIDITGVGRYTPIYDSRGNLMNDGGLTGWSHTYDYQNKIASSIRTKSKTEQEAIRFYFDAFGRKIGRDQAVSSIASIKTSKTSPTDSGRIAASSASYGFPELRYFYDAEGKRIYEIDVQGPLLYIFGLGRRIAKITSDERIEYFHQDHLGSTVAVTSSSDLISSVDCGMDDPQIAKLEIVPQKLPVAYHNNYYRAIVEGKGGWPPYHLTLYNNNTVLGGQVENGKLILTGTPKCGTAALKKKLKEEYFSLEVMVEDSGNPSASISRQYNLTVKCVLD
jgi:YD repeat-containing protein